MTVLNTYTMGTAAFSVTEYCRVYYVQNVTGSTATISKTGGGSSKSIAVSYTGVGSLTGFTATGSLPGNVTATSAVGRTSVFGAWFFNGTGTSGSFTSYNGTQRRQDTTGWQVAGIVGDRPGASSVTHTATISAFTGGALASGAAIDLIPSAGSTTTLTPAGASITVTGIAPSLVTTTVLTPAAATIAVTGTAPKLDIIVTPPGGSLTGALITVTGSAPTLTMSLVTTGATITITGGTPSTAGESVITPAAAAITVTGTAPTLLVSMVSGSTTLPVTGGTPVLIAVTVLSPDAASVTVTGGTPVVINPITLSPAAATIIVVGLNPTITVAVFTAPVPDAEHTIVVRREHRTHVMSGERIHSVRRASRLIEA
jgi:hypothetical protein